MDPREKRIKILLLQADLDQPRVARLVGVSKQMVCMLIKGKRESAPTKAAIERLLAERLGRPVKITWPKAA